MTGPVCPITILPMEALARPSGTSTAQKRCECLTYVGTYTDRMSKGIYACRFSVDCAAGRFHLLPHLSFDMRGNAIMEIVLFQS